MYLLIKPGRPRLLYTSQKGGLYEKMIDLKQLVISSLANNPNVTNNPRSQELLGALQSGDQNRGEELARTLCREHGVSPEQATSQAKKFFNIP